ncbi:hypothetical protein GCM10009665_38770 [Kitasatospora nipponensis]|uniref:Cyclodipeptide synthase n=1 Tax=Kitasatospora nipponensis TaxID=258049 RepID=A0ABN1WFE3_9ACTN
MSPPPPPPPAPPPPPTTPLTARCEGLARRRLHACVGISPFNGYFHAQRIAELARWALEGFDDVHFFVPDTLAAHTLEAVGYPPERAAWKARRQGQHVRNKVTTALTALGLSAQAAQARILAGATLDANDRYRALHQEVRARYRADRAFRAACLEGAHWVLERRLPPGAAPTAAQRATAVRYLLGELPLFLDTPGIVGTAESVFCYHRTPLFLRQLFGGELSCRPVPGQGFLEVAPR